MNDSAPHPSLGRIARWAGEMQLVAAQDAEAGALLVAEYPIAFVETREGEDDIGPWLLLECILTSTPMYDRVVAADLKLTKWPLAADDEANLDRLATTYKRNRAKLAQLYHRVAANNIRYSRDGVTGFGIWPTISRSNHSCDPNAEARGLAKLPLVEALRATRPLRAGEAICWNYFSDASFLALDWFDRNARLHGDFQFLCRCPRCEAERPAGVTGLGRAELVAYFRAGKR
jgi:hypothetical protein